MDDRTIVLFACVHNAGRSQMAAALFNSIADPSKARAISAGTEPADEIHPEVRTAMQEIGLDLRAVTPQLLTDELAAQASVLITMGCGEVCPSIPGIHREDWPLADPSGQSLATVRTIRDQILTRVQDMMAMRGWRYSPPSSHGPVTAKEMPGD